MKVLLISFLLVAGALSKNVVLRKTRAEGPACPIDDPLERDGPLPFNITLHDIVNIEVGSELTNLKVDGLSSLHYEVDVNLSMVTATFDLTIAKVSATAGNYTAAGYIDAHPFSQGTIPSGNFTGEGIGSLSATNVQIHGSASLWVDLMGDKVTVSILNLSTLSFASLSVDLGPGFVIAGSPVDWAAVSAGIKKNFELEYAANKQEILQRIRKSVNVIIEKYTLEELVEIIEGGGEGGEPEC